MRPTSTADRVMLTWLITSPWTVTYWPIMYLLNCQVDENGEDDDMAIGPTDQNITLPKLPIDRKWFAIDQIERYLSFVKLSLAPSGGTSN